MARGVVAGRFEVRGPFGSWGGPAWRVRDLAWQADAVLWELPDGPDAAARARSLAGLRHPGLVPVVDAVEADGRWYAVTARPPGPSLRESSPPWPVPPPPWEVARYGREMLAALRALPAEGLYAPGLGPWSVFPHPPPVGGVALAGFHGPGEPEFTAPERRAGAVPDQPAADLWSLGMVLRALAPGGADDPLAPVLDALLAADPAARPDAARLDAPLAGVPGPAGYPAAPSPSPVPLPLPAPPPLAPEAPAGGLSATAIVLIAVAVLLVPTAVAVAVGLSMTGGNDRPAARASSAAPSGGDGDESGGRTAPGGMRVPEHASGTDGLTIALGEPEAPHTLVV